MCKEYMKSRVDVLLTWIWPCQRPVPQTQGTYKAFLWSKYEGLLAIDQCVQKLATTASSPQMFIAWNCLPTETSYLDYLTPPSHAMHNKSTEVPGYYFILGVALSEPTAHVIPAFLYVCFFLSSPLKALVRFPGPKIHRICLDICLVHLHTY